LTVKAPYLVTMQLAQCALFAFVAANSNIEQIEVTDAGSLRTHTAFTPESLAEVKAKVGALASDFPKMEDNLKKVGVQLENTEAILKAQGREEEDIAGKAAKQELVEREEQTQVMQNIAHYNQAVTASNKLNVGEVADGTAVNSELANFNWLHDHFTTKQAKLQNFEHTLEGTMQKFDNAHTLYTTQCTALDAGSTDIYSWAQHATPVFNTQVTALMQVEGWMNHLEGELQAAVDMAKSLAKNLDIKLPMLEVNECQQQQLMEDGSPVLAKAKTIEQSEQDTALDDAGVDTA